MSNRALSSSNEAALDLSNTRMVRLVNLQTTTPIYAHSGVGTISWNGDDYLGVGALGRIDVIEESEQIVVTEVRVTLDITEVPGRLTEALDAASRGDRITIYRGFRDDNGDLVDGTIEEFSGTFEVCEIPIGKNSEITYVFRNELDTVNRKNGARYTNEDQQIRYASDTGLQFVADSVEKQLKVGGERVRGGGSPSAPGNDFRPDEDEGF